MAALGTFTAASDVEEVVPTEQLSNFVLGFEYAMPVGLGIAWAKPGTGSIPVRFPRWNEVSVPAGTKTESDTFTDVEITTAENSVTPGIVGFRMPLSDEMTVQSLGGIPAQALAQALQALVNRMDADILGASTGYTGTQAGATTDVYTLTRFMADLSLYRAKNIPFAPMGHALNLHENGASDLLLSLGTTAAVFGKQEGDTLRIGPNAGYLGSMYDVAVYSSPNTAVEGGGHSGLLTPIGDQASAYAAVVSQMPYVKQSFGNDADLRAVSYYVFRCWYGTGLASSNRGLEVLHQ